MLPFAIFRTRNFAIGNLATFLLYGGLSVSMFFLVVFLQQVGGYRPLLAGLATLPASILLFLLAKRFGALADRRGPQLFMGIGPIIAGLGFVLLATMGTRPSYLTDVLPGVALFGLGMSITVAPLTSTVLSSAPSAHSGIASGVNNAISRVAGLLVIAGGGAIVSAHFSARVQHAIAAISQRPAATRSAIARAASATLQTHVPSGFSASARAPVHAALVSASVSSFHLAMLLAAALAVVAGLLCLIGISNRPQTA